MPSKGAFMRRVHGADDMGSRLRRTEHLRLAPDEVVRLQPRRVERLRVADGRIWLTQAGSPADVLLERGEEWASERGARVVLQGVGRACVEVVSRPSRPGLAACTVSAMAWAASFLRMPWHPGH